MYDIICNYILNSTYLMLLHIVLYHIVGGVALVQLSQSGGQSSGSKEDSLSGLISVLLGKQVNKRINKTQWKTVIILFFKSVNWREVFFISLWSKECEYLVRQTRILYCRWYFSFHSFNHPLLPFILFYSLTHCSPFSSLSFFSIVSFIHHPSISPPINIRMLDIRVCGGLFWNGIKVIESLYLAEKYSVISHRIDYESGE